MAGLGKVLRPLPNRRVLLRLWMAWAVVLASLLPAAAQAQESLLCRFGVNLHRVNGVTIADFDVPSLRAGSYIDYRADSDPERPGGMRYIMVILLSQVGEDGYSYSPRGAALDAAITANPGAIWYIGNEPDRRGVQDDMLAPVYAKVYHELYYLLKAADPTAKVFPASIVQASELRLAWLDMVVDTYRATYGRPMPVDGWNIHGFVLPEKANNQGAGIPPGFPEEDGEVFDFQENDSVDRFVTQIRRFRRWMHDRGYRDVPLYLSEYGVLMPEGLGYVPDFTPDRVNAFMDATFDFLLNTTNARIGYPPDGNRLVQHLSWYSVNDKGFNGYLFDIDNNNRLSPMGQNYATYTAALAETVDFAPVKLFTLPSAPLVADGNADVTVVADIANAGNLQSAQSVEVRFYHGDPADGGVMIGSPQTVSMPGCGEIRRVSVPWPNVAPGDYEIFVQVEAAGRVADIDRSNDISSQYLFFAEHELYLPFIE